MVGGKPPPQVDDGAWPNLAALFLASGGGLAPQKRIADDKARDGYRKRHRAYFSS